MIEANIERFVFPLQVQAYSFFKKPNITRVDLFGNRITTLDPNALRISAVPPDRALPEFYIGGNPFQCDCNLDWLQKNQTDIRTQPLLMDVASIYCKLLYNRGKVFVPLVEAMATQFLCQYEAHCPTLCHCCDFFACDCKMECPTGCTCYHDQSWSSNVVDCSRANYLDRLPDQIPMDATQIYLDGNRFRTVNNHAFIGRKKLRVLFLNGSSIDTVQNRTFNGLFGLRLLHLGHNRLRRLRGHEFVGCPALRELYLQQNQLTSIANDTFAGLSQLRQLRLDGNRLVQFSANGWGMAINTLVDVRLSENAWSCDCDNVEEILLFMQQMQFVKDRAKMRCVLEGSPTQTGFALMRNETNACADYVALITTSRSNETTTSSAVGAELLANIPHGYWPWIVSSAIAVLVVLCLGCMVIVFLQEVRVWLHSHFGIRWFGGRHTVDDFHEREKLFDAFISYSSKDEAYVAEQLAPVLESGEAPYTLCLHYRDFPVGGVIAETIVQAIESSRRTIMVLSENYIKSEWCRFEFKSAHHRVLRDRKRRLIVIVLGRVPDSLDADIRSYLKTNTYLQWGDRYFWDKLRYALPDVKHEGRLAGCTGPGSAEGVINLAAAQIPPMPTQGSLAAAAAVSALARPNRCHQHPIAVPRGSIRAGFHGPHSGGGGGGAAGHIPMAQLRMSGRMPSAPPASFNVTNMYS